MNEFLANFPPEFKEAFAPTENTIKCPVCLNLIWRHPDNSRIIVDFVCCSNMFSYYCKNKKYYYYFNQTDTYRISTYQFYCLNDFSYYNLDIIYNNLKLDFSDYKLVLKTIEMFNFYR